MLGRYGSHLAALHLFLHLAPFSIRFNSQTHAHTFNSQTHAHYECTRIRIDTRARMQKNWRVVGVWCSSHDTAVCKEGCMSRRLYVKIRLCGARSIKNTPIKDTPSYVKITLCLSKITLCLSKITLCLSKISLCLSISLDVSIGIHQPIYICRSAGTISN